MTDLNGYLQGADDDGLDELSIHRRRDPLGIRPTRETGLPETGGPHDEGGDPACWAHLFDDDDADSAR